MWIGKAYLRQNAPTLQYLPTTQAYLSNISYRIIQVLKYRVAYPHRTIADSENTGLY